MASTESQATPQILPSQAVGEYYSPEEPEAPHTSETATTAPPVPKRSQNLNAQEKPEEHEDSSSPQLLPDDGGDVYPGPEESYEEIAKQTSKVSILKKPKWSDNSINEDSVSCGACLENNYEISS